MCLQRLCCFLRASLGHIESQDCLLHFCQIVVSLFADGNSYLVTIYFLGPNNGNWGDLLIWMTVLGLKYNTILNGAVLQRLGRPPH